MKADSIALDENGIVTLTWSSVNAARCNTFGRFLPGKWEDGPLPTSGTRALGPLSPGYYTFGVQCADAGFTVSDSKSIVVQVGTPPPPILAFSANPAAVPYGATTQLGWSAQNAATCIASGGWAGGRALAGSSASASIVADTTYVLTCTGDGGSVEGRATVKVLGSNRTPLPPAPGSAADTTIEGIDSDADGVRDDLEHYIAAQFPSSARTREALLQLAADFQLATVNRSSRELSRARARAIVETISCVVAATGDYPTAISELEQEHTNTMQRLRAYAEYDQQLLGLSVPLPPENYGTTACKFNATVLAN